MCKFSEQVQKYLSLSQDIKILQDEQKKVKALIEGEKNLWVPETQVTPNTKKIIVKDGERQFEVALTDVITTEVNSAIMVPLFKERGLAGAITELVSKDALKMALNKGAVTEEEAKSAEKIKSCYTTLKIKELK